MAVLRPGMRPLRVSLDGGGVRVLGGTARVASRLACRRAGRGAMAPQKIAASLCPYKTLGVSETADMKEIKQAYRKMALRHHPDRDGGSEPMFLAVQEAYEILVGTRMGKDVDGTAGWDFHDWYWKFLMERNVKRTRPKESTRDHHSSSASLQQVRCQLAGLRHRAAVRAQRIRVHNEQSHRGDERVGSFDVDAAERLEPVGGDGGVQDEAVLFDDDDYNEAMTADSEAEEGRQAYARLCEEARRRQRLSGTEAHQAVRSQLAGLKRRASIRKEMDS